MTSPRDHVINAERSSDLAGVFVPMAWFERNCRRANFGHAALVGIDRRAFLAVYRVFGTSRHFRLASDDAVLPTHPSTVPPSGPTASRSPVCAWPRVVPTVLVLTVERLQGKPAMGLFTATSALGNVWVVLSHGLRLVDLQLSVKSFQLTLQTECNGNIHVIGVWQTSKCFNQRCSARGEIWAAFTPWFHITSTIYLSIYLDGNNLVVIMDGLLWDTDLLLNTWLYLKIIFLSSMTEDIDSWSEQKDFNENIND